MLCVLISFYLLQIGLLDLGFLILQNKQTSKENSDSSFFIDVCFYLSNLMLKPFLIYIYSRFVVYEYTF